MKLCVFLITFPIPCRADFRCPLTDKIAIEGMNEYQVESICGKPAAKTTVQAASTAVVAGTTTGPKNATAEAKVITTPQIDEWTYDFGPMQLIQIIRFEGGILRSERTGGYGKKKKK